MGEQRRTFSYDCRAEDVLPFEVDEVPKGSPRISGDESPSDVELATTDVRRREDDDGSRRRWRGWFGAVREGVTVRGTALPARAPLAARLGGGEAGRLRLCGGASDDDDEDDA